MQLLWVPAIGLGALLLAAWKSPQIKLRVGAYLIASAEASAHAKHMRRERYAELTSAADAKLVAIAGPRELEWRGRFRG